MAACLIVPRWLFVSLFLAACLSLASCDADSESVDALAVDEGYVDVGDGVRLFYRRVGKGGDPLVVLHGGPGFSMAYFGNDLEPLAEHRTLIFYDQRGGGRSTLVQSAEALDAQRFVEDLEALRQHFEIERLNLLGHSWGTAVAALYAKRYPDHVERLLIVGGIPLHQEGLVAAFDRLAESRDEEEKARLQALREAVQADPEDVALCREIYEVWFRPFFGVDDASLHGRMDVCQDSPEALGNKVRHVDRYTFSSLGVWDWRLALRELETPTLILHGKLDPLPWEDAREWAEVLPQGRFLLLDGIGHFPYLEAPEVFFTAAAGFLDGDWPDNAGTVDDSP